MAQAVDYHLVERGVAPRAAAAQLAVAQGADHWAVSAHLAEMEVAHSVGLGAVLTAVGVSLCPVEPAADLKAAAGGALQAVQVEVRSVETGA